MKRLLPEQKCQDKKNQKKDTKLQAARQLIGIKGFLKSFNRISLNINAMHEGCTVKGGGIGILHAGSVGADQNNFIPVEGRIYISIQQIEKADAVAVFSACSGKG